MLELILIDENTTKKELKEFWETVKESDESIVDKWDAKELIESADILEFVTHSINCQDLDKIRFSYYGTQYHITIEKLSHTEYKLDAFTF